MPSARLPLRQIMDSNADPSPNPDAASRRRSGRVVKAPDKFSPEPSNPSVAKRKRDGADDDEEDAENDVPELDEEGSDEGEQDSDENEAATSRRAQKSSQSKRARKPSAKKPKINGSQPAASSRTVTLPRMPKKSVRLDTGERGNGLYGRKYRLRRRVFLLLLIRE